MQLSIKFDAWNERKIELILSFMNKFKLGMSVKVSIVVAFIARDHFGLDFKEKRTHNYQNLDDFDLT